MRQQLGLVLAEIDGELRAQQVMLKNRADATEQGLKEIKAAVEAARSFLDRDLKNTRDHLVQDLEAGKSLLAEKIKAAIVRGRSDLQRTLDRWNQMHHGTIKAVCVRGGVHHGVQRNDFPAELAKPVLDGIAFAWSDYFGEKLAQVLEKWADRLLKHGDVYRATLLNNLASVATASDAVAGMDDVFKSAEKVLREILSQIRDKMEERIGQEQRSLYERVPEQIGANMKQAFYLAAQEKGAGMRQRMVEILSKHAHKVAQTMFDDAR